MQGTPIELLNESQKKGKSRNSDEIIGLEVQSDTEHLNLCIRASVSPAKLSDIVPLARDVCDIIVQKKQKQLQQQNVTVACRNRCSACCSYFVPVSVPEAFRIVEELNEMPEEKAKNILRLSLKAAEKMLADIPDNLILSDSAAVNSLEQFSRWYHKLNIICPFLSDHSCTEYGNRPLACREHLVTGSSEYCKNPGSDSTSPVEMPVSIFQAVSRLSIEFEGTGPEAIAFHLALPWVQTNLERGKKTWPAVEMVRRFVEIVHSIQNQKTDSNTQTVPS